MCRMPRWVECGQPLGCASVGADLPERLAEIWRIDDYVSLAPGAASPAGSVGEHGHGSSCAGDFSQFAAGEKCNEFSVWRPERKSGVLGAVELHVDRVVQ